MKTVVNSAPEREIKFPCLMRSENGVIALFNSPTSGMILKSVDYNGKYFCGLMNSHLSNQNWIPLLPGESVTLIQE
jgi:hypothetical protein